MSFDTDSDSDSVEDEQVVYYNHRQINEFLVSKQKSFWNQLNRRRNQITGSIGAPDLLKMDRMFAMFNLVNYNLIDEIIILKDLFSSRTINEVFSFDLFFQSSNTEGPLFNEKDLFKDYGLHGEYSWSTHAPLCKKLKEFHEKFNVFFETLNSYASQTKHVMILFDEIKADMKEVKETSVDLTKTAFPETLEHLETSLRLRNLHRPADVGAQYPPDFSCFCHQNDPNEAIKAGDIKNPFQLAQIHSDANGCGHVFHAECIEKHLLNSILGESKIQNFIRAGCPLCRQMFGLYDLRRVLTHPPPPTEESGSKKRKTT